jgi:hypothetical protein
MIYFLVNNDYQLLDARRHLQQLREREIAATLIEVPHTLNTVDRTAGFEAVMTFASPLTSHGWLAAWPRYFASARDVVRRLRPDGRDTLLFYTEFELVNHFIALRFKARGAKTVLLEDGGFGTYLPFSIDAAEPLGAKERLIAAMTRRLPDKTIDAVAMYRDVRIVRSIPTLLMHDAERPRIDPIPGKVIFLNERMYDVYQTPEQYVNSLHRILAALIAGFDQVSFKFHPREQDDWTRRIRAILAVTYPSVRIIEERQSIEHLMAEERPEVLASYFSTTLLNLGTCGVEPLYLYHLFEELAQQKIFRQTTTLLAQWHYRFVQSLTDVRAGYQSGFDRPDERARLNVCDLAADRL